MNRGRRGEDIFADSNDYAAFIAHDERTGETYVLQMDVGKLASSEMMKLLNFDFPHSLAEFRNIHLFFKATAIHTF